MKLFESECKTQEEKEEFFNLQYERAIADGQKRFGSECQHKDIRGGICKNCLRKVVSR